MSSRRCLTLFVVCLAVALLLPGCAPMVKGTVVELSRERYAPQLNPDDYRELQGKTILMHGITDRSTNTANFYYYSPDRTVGYQGYYGPPSASMPQPLVSFFWYALEKGFEKAGLQIESTAPKFDAELLIVFHSLTDRELLFNATLRREKQFFYSRDYIVRTPELKTAGKEALEQRAYGMIDATVKAILADPALPKALIR